MTIHPCIISSRIEVHIHMHLQADKYPKFKHFLVPIRNPVNRLISWFNFEIYAQLLSPIEWENILFEKLWTECYSTIGEVLADGLIDDTISSTYDRPVFSSAQELISVRILPINGTHGLNQSHSGDNNISTDKSSNVNATKTVVVAENPTVELSCRQIATECVTGRVPCFAHNFYNNEVYLEDLILWKQTCTNTTSSAATSSSQNGTAIDTHNDNNNNNSGGTRPFSIEEATEKLHTYGPPHNYLYCGGRQHIRIDVIRTEQVELDFNRTMKLWTGYPLESLQDIGYAVSNSAESNNVTSRSNFVPQSDITKLCKQICPELIAYKKILYYADNLYGQDVIDSWNELDQRCDMDVDKVCGTTFVYRAIKRQKKMI